MNSGILKLKTLKGIRNTSLLTSYKIFFEVASRLILIRILVPDIFGLMTFAYLIKGFVSTTATLSSEKALIQRKKVDKNFFDTAATSELILSLIGAGVLFLLSANLMKFLGKPELTNFVRALSLTIPLTTYTMTLRSYLVRNLDFKKANTAALISTPIGAIAIVIFAIAGFHIWSFFWGELIAGIISLIIMWRILPTKPILKLDVKSLSKIKKFGLPLTGSAVLGYFYWNIDDLIVGMMLGMRELGFYWLAFKIPHYILRAQAGMTEVAYPAFSRAKDDKQLARGFSSITKYSALILLLPTAIVILFGQPTVKYFFGNNWLPATLTFQIFTFLVAFRGIFGYWAQALIAKKKTKVLFLIMLQSALILPPMGYLLTKKYGIAGMATAVLLTILLTTPYMVINLKRIITVNYVKLLFRIFLSFTMVLIIGLGIRNFADESVINYITSVVFLSAIYLAFSFTFDRKLLKEIKKILKILK